MTDGDGFLLTLTCADHPGIVHAVSGFLVSQGCDIIDSQQFGDRESGRFFLRIHFSPTNGVATAATTQALRAAFSPVAAAHGMKWELHAAAERPRLLIMVSRFGHCLNDLLYSRRAGTLRIDIPVIVSNHTDFAGLAASYGIPFEHVPVTAATKAEAEARLLALVEEHRIDLVVLARYMQILSEDLCKRLDGRAINIHHSFLPSFKGAKPYHQAHARGVKLVGATAHYVTPDLDEGPIIEQEVIRADHTFSPEDLVTAGRDAECLALARAVRWHVERRVLLNGARTVVFR
ncbi:formyltetrahydrofolate deformylase [Catenulispora subtropica]|uniref:Formyltetrahydrofolate deformylase n=1 Tax=Catenulispora subtropica TaxID=450798 RepID=A0ABP5DX50_9ACTN